MTDTPIKTMFDVQRAATKQTARMLQRSVETQRATGQLLRNSLRMQQTAQHQSLKLAEAATRNYLETVDAAAGAERTADGRRDAEETVRRLEETHEQFYDAVDDELDRNMTSFDDVAGQYREALDEWTEQLVEAIDTIEEQSVEGYEAFTGQLDEQLELAREMQAELDEQFEQQSEQAEALLEQQAEQAEALQQDLAAEAERTRSELDRETEDAGRRIEIEAPDRGPEHDLEDVTGIGAATRADLEEAGIDSVEALADADPALVAEAVGTSEDRVQEWIDQARGWADPAA